MEKIDLNNYEAYFLDFMEGNLAVEEKRDLFDFLEVHPELKSEMENDFGGLELFPEFTEFDHKSSLKIDESDLILSLNTIDELMIASIEGQLSKKHEAQLQAYLQKNNLGRKYAGYQATILKADPAVQYPDKENLKKETRVIRFPLYARIASIAAVGLLLIGFAIDWNQLNNPVNTNTDRNSVSFAKVKWTPALIKSNGGADLNIAEQEINPTESPQRKVQERNENSIQKNLDALGPKDLMVSDDEPRLDSAKDEQKAIIKLDLKQPELDEPEFVENPPIDSLNIEYKIKEDEEKAIFASNHKVRKEEPFKIVTDAASDVVNKNIQFTRDKDVASNEYVAYSFKLGNFEFERKKAR